MTGHASSRTVLLAEDDDSLATLFTNWLESEYTVVRAANGEDALELIDETVDIGLLDRNMPERSGDEVLRALGSQSSHWPIGMVTSVEPEFDVLDLDCQEYLRKPITKCELRGTVDRLCKLTDCEKRLQTYYTLLAKKELLETHHTSAILSSRPEYQTLLEEIAAMEEQLDATVLDTDVNTSRFELLPTTPCISDSDDD
ncbi:response regulator transcription factor [Halorhabdus amylolytica]|uniref:response regulator transcription factor n=1 Tax=Halorhabdus amylolytica TaxID=2559573 RepID=UPI0010AB1837|nr:response regulator [Halorhabdus amylolytica]